MTTLTSQTTQTTLTTVTTLTTWTIDGLDHVHQIFSECISSRLTTLTTLSSLGLPGPLWPIDPLWQPWLIKDLSIRFLQSSHCLLGLVFILSLSSLLTHSRQYFSPLLFRWGCSLQNAEKQAALFNVVPYWFPLGEVAIRIRLEICQNKITRPQLLRQKLRQKARNSRPLLICNKRALMAWNRIKPMKSSFHHFHHLYRILHSKCANFDSKCLNLHC